MSSVRRFSDLIAWQKARVLASRIYQATRNERFSRDFGLSNQVQRASTSVMANIAEGFERDGRAEFFHFLTIARASCAEVQSHLYLALDARHITSSEFDELLRMADEVSRIVSGLRLAVKKQRDGT